MEKKQKKLYCYIEFALGFTTQVWKLQMRYSKMPGQARLARMQSQLSPDVKCHTKMI